MIELEKKNDTTPLCPHCEHPQNRIHYHSLKAFLGRRYVYFCANCTKILSISHRKGFLMG